MKNEELRSQLAKLHNELRQTRDLDLQQRELLQTLADEIQALLKRDEIQQHHYTSLSERLNDGVAEQITLLMRQTIDSLAYLGI